MARVPEDPHYDKSPASSTQRYCEHAITRPKSSFIARLKNEAPPIYRPGLKFFIGL